MWNKVAIFFACVLIYFYKRSFQSERTSLLFYYKFFIYYSVVVLTTGLSWPLFLFKPRNVQNAKLLIPIARLISWALNLSWEIRDGEVLSKERGAVIVSNHQSSLDLIGQLHAWEIADKMTCIAKKELFYLWPFGLSAYLTGVVFIDRRKAREAYKMLFKTSEVMTRDKTKIWMFPEGTRNMNPEFLPFKKGAFTIAVAAQVPIIPVVYSPYHFLDVEKKTFDDGRMIIQCLEEVPTAGMTQDDVPALMDTVRSKMTIAFQQLRKEVLYDAPSKFSKLRNCT